MNIKNIIIVVTLVMSNFYSALAQDNSSREKWFKDAKFGIFIHWGVYSQYGGMYKGKESGGYAEWILHNEKIPIADYKEVGSKFNPTKYDPELWAQTVMESGAKYLVITSKHHDGYTLFDTEYSDWGIMNSTYGRDLIKPLEEACKKRGIKFGLYYSHAVDWINGGAQSTPKLSAANMPIVDYDTYLQTISINQTTEILRKYNPDLLWWDMPVNMTEERAIPFKKLLETEYPNVLSNSRLSKGNDGDFSTYEQSIPSSPILDSSWESCMTMNNTWGYRSIDHDWKSTKKLLYNLIGTTSKGGNFLLNIGPDGQGVIPRVTLERLKDIGTWLKVNGEAIYGTQATPFLFKQAWKGATTHRIDKKGNTILYLHVYDWPSDAKLRVLGVQNKGCKASVLATDEHLKITKLDNGYVIDLPKNKIDKYSSTIKVVVPGKLLIKNDSFFVTTDGVSLYALDSKIQGKVKRKNVKDNLIEGLSLDTKLSWKVSFPEAGRYTLKINAGTTSNRLLNLKLQGENYKIKVSNTFRKHYGSGLMPSVELGVVTIKQGGIYEIELSPIDDNWEDGITIQSLEIKSLKIEQDGDGNINLPSIGAVGYNNYFNYSAAVYPKNKLEWEFYITRQSGKFSVVVDYSSNKEIKTILKSSTDKLKITLPNTFGNHRRVKISVGNLNISSSGKNKVTLEGEMSGLELYGIKLLLGNDWINDDNIVTKFPKSTVRIWKTSHSNIELYKGANAVDRDEKTFWRTRPKVILPEYLEVDYGKQIPVNHLYLSTGSDKAYHRIFKADLQVLTPDGWKLVTKLENVGNNFNIDFEEVTGRIFRLNVIKANLISIAEIKLEKK